MARRLTLLLASALFAATIGTTNDAAARGYTPRGCGLDMDRDGLVGEPADCMVCNAYVSGGVVTGGTTDPDGDGVNEDMIYVDCDAGTDRVNCGRPGQPPCRTLAYGLAETDGAGDGAEDIICFQGTCTPNLLKPTNGGVPGSYTVPPYGNQTRSWEFPLDPAMIVGWDADGDGEYPPFDKDDLALMDGGPPNLNSRTFVMKTGTTDYYELAHFEVKDYGHINVSTLNVGFMSPQGSRYLYIHDIEADGINQDRGDIQACAGDSAVSVFNVFGTAGLKYFAVINSSFTNFGGFWMRGSPGFSDAQSAGPIRVQNNTMTAHGADGCSRGPMLAKLWGYVNDFELLDNVVDGNVTAWDATQRGAQGITIAQCARGFDIVNNEFKDLFVATHIQGSAHGACENADARTIDDVTIAWNDVHTTSVIDRTNGFTGVIGVQLTDGGDSAGETSENITIVNNKMSCAYDCQACLMVNETYSGPALNNMVKYDFNTCDLADLSSGNGYTGSVVMLNTAPTHRNGFDIHNNALTGHTNGDLAMNLQEAPSSWNVDDNCYDPDADFRWNGSSATDMASWQSRSGGDLNSLLANPCPVPEPSSFLVGLTTLATLATVKSSSLRRAARRSR